MRLPADVHSLKTAKSSEIHTCELELQMRNPPYFLDTQED